MFTILSPFRGVAFVPFLALYLVKSVLPRADIRIRIRRGVIRIRIRKPGIRVVIRITAEMHALRTNSLYIYLLQIVARSAGSHGSLSREFVTFLNLVKNVLYFRAVGKELFFSFVVGRYGFRVLYLH